MRLEIIIFKVGCRGQKQKMETNVDSAEFSERSEADTNEELLATGGENPQANSSQAGKEAINTNQTNTTEFNKSAANPISTQNDLFNVRTPSYAAFSLPSLPDSSLVEDGSAGRSWQEKTPVDNICQFSVQIPSPGMTIRIFLLERTYPERNQKRVFLYLIPEGECKVYEKIRRDFKEEEIHESFTRQMPFTVNNNSTTQEFHTVYIQEHITVEFEIENRFQENFVALNQRNESVFRVPFIESESKGRQAKGAKSQFVVQYVGEPGTPCQEQGKITLTVDSRDQTTLFFSLAIWSSMHGVHEDQPG